MSARAHRVVVIRGDGIGPELVDSALAVLDAVERHSGGFHLELEFHEGGAAQYQRVGQALTPDSLDACRKADAILKGPVGLPWVQRPDGTEAGLLGGILRNGLDLYANVRPIKLFPGIPAPIKREPGQVDYVIVRENTEGLYLSRGLGVGNDNAVADVMLMTRPGVERIARFAFDLARTRNGAPKDGVRRVTCVDKSNVLRSMAFFRRVYDEVGERYPDVQRDYLYSDACAQALVMEPERFDVLVMENFLGDLLSDLGGGTVGGLGLCPSGNYGDRIAYFEPIHGSAPTLAGKDRASPLSQIGCLAMLLDKVGEAKAARQVETAIWRALESGALKMGADGCPVGGTRAATQAVIEHLG
ncbi:MAG: isocitrate/isopropylmalate dehydrogenase family protein [Chloroflexi bacterium]|nr:isocitrate/isopropylmalate dehydrogenase family protein [Chloroflexota bacterium]